MRASVLLRIAAVLTLLHGVLHTIGGAFGQPPPGAQETAVLAMKANQFPAMGVMRTYWDFFMGYGLVITVGFLVQAVVFWQLASLVKTDAGRARPMVMAFSVSYMAYAVVSLRYFFVAPVVLELVIALCLLGAWVLAARTERMA